MIENFGDKINTEGFDKHPENINTEGYEKGKKHRATILRRLVDTASKFKNPVTKKEESGIVEDQLDWSLIIKGLGGDVQAIKEIKDTLYGKVPDKNQLTGADGKDLIPTIIGMQIIKDDTDTKT